MTQAPPSPLDELYAVYAEMDEAYREYGCPSSTDCCHFDRTGREPYVTSVELEAVKIAIRKTGRRRPGPSRAKRHLAVMSDEGRCPLLEVQGGAGRCSIYAARPLGCRTFYCRRADHGPLPHREIQTWVRKIQVIATRHRTGGDLGRTLRAALARDSGRQK